MRLVRLDILRGIAAFVVAWSHYRWLFLPGLAMHGPLPAWIRWSEFGGGGSTAVQIFWVLSGIVFFHAYDGEPFSKRDFFWRRFARLYPLHFATLLIIALLDLLHLWLLGAPKIPYLDWPHFLVQLALASHWTPWLSQTAYNVPMVCFA